MTVKELSAPSSQTQNHGAGQSSEICPDLQCAWHKAAPDQQQPALKIAANKYLTSLKTLDETQGRAENLKGNPLTIIGGDKGVEKKLLGETTPSRTTIGQAIDANVLPQKAQEANAAAKEVFDTIGGLSAQCKNEAVKSLKSTFYGAWKNADYRIAHNIALNNSDKIDNL
jgi:hypothetical protein